MQSRANVLFIVIDQMREEILSGTFAEIAKLPNLRALMADAVSFQNHEIHPFVTTVQKKAKASDVVGFPGLVDSEETAAEIRAIYLDLATGVDHHIGRIIQWIKVRGQNDDTILVVTADHSEILGDLGIWGKEAFHDEAFKIPSILRAPGQPRGVDVKEPTESVDIMPKRLEMIGCDVLALAVGCDLDPLLQAKTGNCRSVMFSEIDFGDPVRPSSMQEHLGFHSDQYHFAILRSSTHRLVHFGGGLSQILFDMTKDGESLDISRITDSSTISFELTKLMLSHRMEHGDATFSRFSVKGLGVKEGRA